MSEDENFEALVNGIDIDVEKVAEKAIGEIFNNNPRVSAIMGLLQFGRSTAKMMYDEAQQQGVDLSKVVDEDGLDLSNKILRTIWSCLEILDPSINKDELVQALDQMSEIDSIMESMSNGK
jgi:hypothetical protein